MTLKLAELTCGNDETMMNEVWESQMAVSGKSGVSRHCTQ